jgi:hypothetical protein
MKLFQVIMMALQYLYKISSCVSIALARVTRQASRYDIVLGIWASLGHWHKMILGQLGNVAIAVRATMAVIHQYLLPLPLCKRGWKIEFTSYAPLSVVSLKCQSLMLWFLFKPSSMPNGSQLSIVDFMALLVFFVFCQSPLFIALIVFFLLGADLFAMRFLVLASLFDIGIIIGAPSRFAFHVLIVAAIGPSCLVTSAIDFWERSAAPSLVANCAPIFCAVLADTILATVNALAYKFRFHNPSISHNYSIRMRRMQCQQYA